MDLKPGPLAILGGSPAFAHKLHVGAPNFGDREAFNARMAGVFDRRWFTNDGPLVREFEAEIARRIGVKRCVATCNATIALEIAIRAAGLTGEVIVPSFTFIATAHALRWPEITPVFCDIDPATHNIDPDQVEALITPRTTGILGVHVWGRPAPVERLAEIAAKRKLVLLFDAAHAFGCSHRGRPIGSFGLAEVLSFHATKVLNSFEGGAVVTNDDALADKIRLMRNFGFADYDKVVTIGTNGKMTEASAAMGLTNLESLDHFIAVNRRNYEAYARALADLPGIALIPYDRREANNFHYVVLEVNEERFGLTRDELAAVLHAENVLARRYFHPGCHRMEPYRTQFPEVRLPWTEQLSARVLVLPTGAGVDELAIERIGRILRDARGLGPEIRGR